MGGSGSGNRYRWDTKTTADSCHAIDVRRWHREGKFRPGTTFSWAWLRDDVIRASIGVVVHEHGVELRYTVSPNTEQAEKVQYTIPLTWTPCTYGGRRPWFLCPGVVDGRACGRRVAKLYDRGRYFLCRHCYDLTYESRRESPMHRGLSRAQDIRKRLGGTANMTEPFPRKPKGMHWRTYERLRDRADAGEYLWYAGLQAWLDRSNKRIDRMTACRP